MKEILDRLFAVTALLAAAVLNAPAATLYVDVNSTNPETPYAGWSTAASDIQDAIDISTNGDLILVTNGVYATGGRTVNGYALTNRVVIDKAVTVQSVNGPGVTTIQGYQVPGTTNGDSAVRCVYLTNSAALIGFTLTHGATRASGDWDNEESGGGIWCDSTNPVISNCVIVGNSAGDSGGGAIDGTFINCTFIDNYAFDAGGGVYNSTMIGCTLTGNFGNWGGGGGFYPYWISNGSMVNDCSFMNNATAYEGGGVWGGTLNLCVLSNNIATDNYYQDGYGVGGGAEGSTLNNCVITGNAATGVNAYGGGADSCNVYNSVVYDNSSESDGGGLSYCAGSGCTITGNSAQRTGGGLEGSEMQNCIIYYNTAPLGANYYGSGCSSCDAMDYCDTTPLPPPGVGGGVGNITAEPQLADFAHIAANSPCRGSGVAAYSVGVDIDNEPWASPPSMGCDEYHGPITGPLNVGMQASYTNATVGFQVRLVAEIGGHASTSRWDLRDGTMITNHPYISHIWNTPGDYTVTLTAYNDDFPGGVTASVVLHIAQPAVSYVNAGNPNPVAPYNSWATAATNIQDAVDAASLEALVLVTNGIYQLGGRVVHGAVTNRLAVDRPVIVRSVNGPSATIIDGGGVMRCVYLTNDAVLVGFTLRNGCTLGSADSLYDESGGGAWCESGSATLFNCILSSNTASADGGGVLGGTLANSAVTFNSAAGNGGGANSSVLNNCTVTGNAAADGGGIHLCDLKNCIIYYDSALNNADYSASSLNYCCTMTLPASGVANTSSEPQLADAIHLSAGSPCRGAGNPAYVSGLDIDGEPWADPPSMGCAEYYSNGITGALSVAIVTASTNVPQGFAVNFTGQIAGHAGTSIWDFGDGTVVSNRPFISHSWLVPGDYPVVLTAYNADNPNGVSASKIMHVVESISYVALTSTNPVAPYSSWATAATNIQDAVDAAYVGSTVLISNGVYNTGGQAVSGTSNRVTVLKQMTLRSLNGPGSVLIDGEQVMRCVYLTNFATLIGVTLTNGSGGGVAGQSTFAVVSNCVMVGNAGSGAAYCTLNDSIVSSNTAYDGGGVFRCTANQCAIIGNSVNGDYAEGGGVFQSTLNNSVVFNNSANGSGAIGGGVEQSTLNNCLVISNSAPYIGGVDYSTINNCTIVGNSASGHSDSWGGGTGNCSPNNSIVYYNNAPNAPNIGYSSGASYCCTPEASSGPGNFTNEPAFVNLAGGDFHLRSNSPCINAGNNTYVTDGTDSDGNPRIVGGTVDMGTYEYQSPVSRISYAWLQQYGLPITTNIDTSDLDGTGFNVFQDWIAGLNPTNSLSVLAMISPVPTNNPAGLIVSWKSVSNRIYFVQSSTNLGMQPAFSTIQSNIVGQPDVTSFMDTNAVGQGPFFYRVGVQQ